MSLRDTIRDTMRGLGEAFKQLKLLISDREVQEERDSTSAFLASLLDTLRSVTDSFLDDALLSQLQIELHQSLSGEGLGLGPFFSPWSAERMNAYPIDMDDEETARDIHSAEKIIDCGPEFPGPYTNITATRVSALSGYISSLMHCRRMPHGSKLRHISDWRGSSFPLPADYHRLCRGRPRWEATELWFRPKSKKLPHAKVLLENPIEGKEGVPTREEIFIIAFTMMCRLQEEGMRDHVIAPVMLISIMGECHGRILIGHYDGSKLVIQMSELHCLYSGYTDSYMFMMRYMVAGTEGDTTTLLADRGS